MFVSEVSCQEVNEDIEVFIISLKNEWSKNLRHRGIYHFFKKINDVKIEDSVFYNFF